jgi:hypothetical protein
MAQAFCFFPHFSLFTRRYVFELQAFTPFFAPGVSATLCFGQLPEERIPGFNG